MKRSRNLAERSAASLTLNGRRFQIFSIKKLGKLLDCDTSRLPYSVRILLESALRNHDGLKITEGDVRNLAEWSPRSAQKGLLVSFKPARVLLQDFTGVPALVDLAAMRDAAGRAGIDPARVNPQVPCELVVDHSVQVDRAGNARAAKENLRIEYERNRERYEFLKWGENAFQNFRIVPPATGIIHQVNLEYLARGVFVQKTSSGTCVYPDSLIGTDSHTTMAGGIALVGWGVGGIEAEAVMLGEPLGMLLPEVVGFRLKGELPKGVTATDLVLTVTQMLRKSGVVGKFVEFFGPAYASLDAADRSTIANMAPEYGATIGYFPPDERTLEYYRLTGRPSRLTDLYRAYMKAQGLWYSKKNPTPEYSAVVELDLASVEPSLAGPRRPQDRVRLGGLGHSYRAAAGELQGHANADAGGVTHGSVVIAAITSCTNTSNPSVMMAAGLLAKNAVARGLKVKSFVKTSLAPGSPVVTDYLKAAGVLGALERLGFFVVGYGCTTCIGNSGPLDEKVAAVIRRDQLHVARVLSGNRNFAGRVHPAVKSNYLASPPLVVALALAGTVNIDLETEPVATDRRGKPVFLKDLWPSNAEIQKALSRAVATRQFKIRGKGLFEGTVEWKRIRASRSGIYSWDPKSTYIHEPPFFKSPSSASSRPGDIHGARALAVLGDSVTTDHISPAGAIHPESPAGKFLLSRGVPAAEFNSYGSRRGNDEVMVRGTFANVRLKNLLAEGREGPWTRVMPSGPVTSIYEAAREYAAAGVPLLVLAGQEYGTGSSRDWAAKGTALLGVRAVLAQSYERIHRQNLVGMGVLPLEFVKGQGVKELGLTGEELYDIGVHDAMSPRCRMKVAAVAPGGKRTVFEAVLRIDTPVEMEYIKSGGLLPYVLKKLAV
ncbi:MAG: aconitate hydratase AcnA [Candidatus Omnitrophica bacterium]|nr:aconitate hydratase AcnA [Candidatus Omnitrophota bacterium]